MRNAVICLVALLAQFSNTCAAAGGLDLFPQYYGELSIKFFQGQSRPLQEHRYVSEETVSLELALARRGALSVFCNVDLLTGMGDSVARYLPFSPIDTSGHVSAILEYEHDENLYRLGWHHTSDHLVYKDGSRPWYLNEGAGIEPDVYYNRAFMAAGSGLIRRPVLHDAIFGERSEGLASPIWYVEAAWYVRHLFGLMDSRSLSGGHDWSWDFETELRYPIRIGGSYALVLGNRTVVMIDGAGRAYWRDTAELEALLNWGGYGTSLFLSATPIDEHPRDSREGLYALGARVFF